MKKRNSRVSLVSFKIDLMKAYNRVYWSLLTRIISKFGFSSKVNAFILGCISIESVELLLNCIVFSKIDMQRRLKRRDLLSSFLFIFYFKLLSRMLLKLEREGKLHRIKIRISNPTISHLLFTDNILLFCKKNLEEVREVINCLNLFCSWSGQREKKTMQSLVVSSWRILIAR